MVPMALLQLFILAQVLLPYQVHAIDLAKCGVELGMKNGAIPDHYISSSSHFDAAVNAIYGRAHVEAGGGAWCPRAMVYREGKEFLEVNLGTPHLLSKVEVQGRFGNGQGREFAEQFKVQYWRPDLPHWNTYTDRQGNQILEGNSNTYLATSTKLVPAIIATRVRFLPYSHHPRTVCMRVELYGCPYTEGVVSYSMEDGDPRGGDDGLLDLRYDGSKSTDAWLTSGLGQLTDGEIGHTNFRVDVRGVGRGYEWVGWKNDTRNERPIEISFEFDMVRNFSAMHIYTNNFFTRDVQVFSHARVLFSLDGELYNEHPYVDFTYIADRIFDNARNVTIKLHNTPAKFIKLQLSFALKWMMISEVAFNSVPCGCNTTLDIIHTTPSVMINKTEDIQAPAVPVSDRSTGLLLGGLVTLGVVFCVIPMSLGVLYYRNRLSKKNLTKAAFSVTSEAGVSDGHKVSMKMKDMHMTMNVAPVNNGYSRAKGNVYGHVAMDDESESGLYQEPYKGPTHNPGYYTLRQQDSSMKCSIPLDDTQDSGDYAVPDLSYKPPIPYSDMFTTVPPPVPSSRPPIVRATNNTHPTVPVASIPPIMPASDSQYYSSSPVCQSTNIQGVTGTAIYALSDKAKMSKERTVPELSHQQLRIVDTLGEGLFGRVQLCEITNMSGNESVRNDKHLVAVKSLKPGVGKEAEESFCQEIKILGRVDDPNIVRLVGTVTQENPLAMVLEYCDHGDLHQFLRRHVIEGNGSPRSVPLGATGSSKPISLSYCALIHIATQIAAGMKHLETLNLVHRDLSARNCLVGRGLKIKVADFGMSRSLYSSDYYRLSEGCALLPIRWMAWESVLQGRFSSKSDVWSFGVTLWEILTMARRQPYSELSDSGVLENLSNCYHSDGADMLLLPLPSLCPREMYEMMCTCWLADEEQRPPFWEIHMFLQRKNLGYIVDYID
ncbi:unnamed protein product [Meganyctiphanes norvegica]|uniref:Uncharacterized protein n=1 Tax=Meganyctiphanes norvegica TaxID=48144 RepID=A0AAV2Q675_MEGNR